MWPQVYMYKSNKPQKRLLVLNGYQQSRDDSGMVDCVAKEKGVITIRGVNFMYFTGMFKQE